MLGEDEVCEGDQSASLMSWRFPSLLTIDARYTSSSPLLPVRTDVLIANMVTAIFSGLSVCPLPQMYSS